MLIEKDNLDLLSRLKDKQSVVYIVKVMNRFYTSARGHFHQGIYLQALKDEVRLIG
jgi:hypothetical protein